MKLGSGLVGVCVVVGFAAAASAQLKRGSEPADGPAMDQVSHYIDVMEKYLYVVDHVARLSDNATASGVAAVLNAEDLLKDKPQDAIDYFVKLLPEVKNESVKRAIRLQLADLYKKTNQPDKALEQLSELIVSAPPHTAAGSGRTTEKK